MELKKRHFVYIILAAALIVTGIYYLALKLSEKPSIVIEPPRNTRKEILDSLRASTSGDELPEGVIKTLRAPSGGNPPSQEVLDSLTAPNG